MSDTLSAAFKFFLSSVDTGLIFEQKIVKNNKKNIILAILLINYFDFN